MCVLRILFDNCIEIVNGLGVQLYHLVCFGTFMDVPDIGWNHVDCA